MVHSIHYLFFTFPGRGVPNQIKQRTNRLLPIAENGIPEANEARDMYVYLYDGVLTEVPKFGSDPISDNANLCHVRLERFSQRYKFDAIFNNILENNGQYFQHAISYFIELTIELSH